MLQAQAESETPERVQDNPQILAMVQGLAARLETDPQDLDGWLRLMRSYVVLDERDLALEAYETATATFETDVDAITQIRSLAEELGLLSVD